MGVSKTDLFNAEQNKLASLAKALAHPARIAILQHLIEINACVNGDFVTELGLAQPTVSQHLRELKEAGLIKGSINGKRKSYCINLDQWRTLSSEFTSFFNRVDLGSSCD